MSGMANEVDADQFAEQRAMLTWLPMQVIEWLNTMTHVYDPKSTAAGDAEAIDHEAIRTILSLAWLAIMSASDHMTALERALCAPVLSFAPWTIARTILEASAQSSWICDPQISPEERLSRVLVLRLSDVTDQVRFVKSMTSIDGVQFPENSVADQDSKKRRSEIIKRARDYGIPIKTGKKGDVTKIGPTPVLIKTTDLVMQAFDQAAASDYRLLSGVEHQHFSPQRFLAMSEVQGSSGVSHPSLSLKSFFYLLGSALRWYGTSVWIYFDYCGFDIDWLGGVLSKIVQQTGMKDHFWTRA